MSNPPICGEWTRSGGVSPISSSRLQAVMTSSHSLRNRLRLVMSTPGTEGVLQRAERALGDLARRRSDLAENDRQLVDALLSYRDSLAARLHQLLPESIDAMKIRHHGDFHL